MKGWRTRSFREKAFFHHRTLGTAERGRLRSLFSYGQKDYYLGGHPLWELFRVGYRLAKRPYLLGGLAVGLGYAWAWLSRIDRAVSADLMRFHRKEQMRKLRAILRSALTFKRIDNFQVLPELGLRLMQPLPVDSIRAALRQFVGWLDRYGETSYDFQSFFAGTLGRRAKALYYRNPPLGTIAVLPMVACEALLPSARRLFWIRNDSLSPMPITRWALRSFRERSTPQPITAAPCIFSRFSRKTRCPGYEREGWGYPFDWETRAGHHQERHASHYDPALCVRGVSGSLPAR